MQVIESINKCDVDIRRELFSSILVIIKCYTCSEIRNGLSKECWLVWMLILFFAVLNRRLCYALSPLFSDLFRHFNIVGLHCNNTTFRCPNTIKWLPLRVEYGVGYTQPYSYYTLINDDKEVVFDWPL